MEQVGNVMSSVIDKVFDEVKEIIPIGTKASTLPDDDIAPDSIEGLGEELKSLTKSSEIV